MPTSKKTTPRLKKTPNKDIANRLRTLRNDRGLTLIETAEKLQPYVDINLEGSVGRSAISNVETQKQNLTLELAVAYSRVFNASLEYVLCLTDDRQPENKAIKETIGLSDKSIDIITGYGKSEGREGSYPPYLQIMNSLYENGFMRKVIVAFHFYLRDKLTQNAYVEMKNYAESQIEFLRDEKKRMAIWQLNDSISTAIKEIDEQLLVDYSSLYEGRLV